MGVVFDSNVHGVCVFFFPRVPATLKQSFYRNLTTSKHQRKNSYERFS